MKEIVRKFKYLWILVLVVSAFAMGRYTVPIKVQVQEKYVDRVVEKIDTTRVNELTQQVTSLKNEIVTMKQSTQKTVHSIKKKDGTVETTVTINSLSETDKRVDDSSTNQTSTKTEEKEHRHVDSIVLHEKKAMTTREPSQWVVTVLGGSQLDKIKLTSQAPFLDPLILGVVVNRRIIGPVFFGIWANTSKQAGLSLSLEF